MRFVTLFRNRLTDVDDARQIVVAADVVAAAAVALGGTGAFDHGPDAVRWIALLAWGAYPRLLAAGIEPSLARARGPHARTRIVGSGVAALLLGSLLFFFVLARSSHPGDLQMLGIVGAFLMSGFMLFDPAAYAWYEPFSFGAMAAGVIGGFRFSMPLTVVAFCSMCVSNAVRRQLSAAAAVAAARGGRGRVNVQNARVAAFLVIVAFIGIVAGLFIAADPLVDRVEKILERRAAEKRDRSRAEEEHSRVENSLLTAREGGRAGAMGMRLSRRSSLNAAFDETIVLRITRPNAPSTPADETWSPNSDTYWRGRVFERFDPRLQDWSTRFTDPLPLEQEPEGFRFDAPVTGVAPQELVVTVVVPEVGSLFMPYFPTGFTVRPARAALPEIRSTPHGDYYFKGAGLERDSSYRVTVRPFVGRNSEESGFARGRKDPEMFLEVPDRSALGLDLGSLARAVFGDATGLRANLEALHDYARGYFTYGRETTRRHLPETLVDFVTRKRVGDCRHFATLGALLLRARGIPTRIAVGFLGAEPGERPDEWLVKRRTAHAWVEVETNDLGWTPVDLTENVARDPDPVGPNGSAEFDDVSGVGGAEVKDPGLGRDRGDRGGPGDDGADPASDSVAPPRLSRAAAAFLGALALGAFLIFLVLRLRQRKSGPKEEEPQEPSEPAPQPMLPPAWEGYRPRTESERLLLAYAFLQKDLTGSGRERREHETPREHAARVSPTPAAPAHDSFGSVVPMVNDALYGAAEITAEQAAKGRGALDDIRRALG